MTSGDLGLPALPDDVWEMIEPHLPCSPDRTLIQIEGEDQGEVLELVLTPRQYIELRLVGGLAPMLTYSRAEERERAQERKTREDALKRVDSFIANLIKVRGAALKLADHVDLRELLSVTPMEDFNGIAQQLLTQMQTAAANERKAIAEIKRGRGRPKRSSHDTVSLLDILAVYRELGGDLKTAYSEEIGAYGPAVSFLALTAEAILHKPMTKNAAREFIRDNSHRIDEHGLICSGQIDNYDL